MQQTKLRNRLVGLSLLSVMTLVGIFAVLSTTRTDRGRRTVGLMPEVVCTADRSDCVTGEIVVRAQNPNRIAFAAARVSEIN